MARSERTKSSRNSILGRQQGTGRGGRAAPPGQSQSPAPDEAEFVGCDQTIYEFFCAAQAAGTHFLVRACVDRLAGDGRHTIADEMGEVAVQGLHRVEVAGDDGKTSQASVELGYGGSWVTTV